MFEIFAEMKTRSGSTFCLHISVKLNVNDLFQKFVGGGGEERTTCSFVFKKVALSIKPPLTYKLIVSLPKFSLKFILV